MSVRSADAMWEGDLKSGKGIMKLSGGAYEAPFSFNSRFGEGKGTNPEELIAAAHAGCFSMAFSNGLAKAGFTPKRVSTNAKATLEKVGEVTKITTVELSTEGLVPGIDEKTFQQVAEDAKKNCPISQTLVGVNIILHAKLMK